MNDNRQIFRGECYWYFTETKENSSCQGGNYSRPVVILQNDIGNKFSSTTIIAPISSKIKKTHQATHVLIGEECGVKRTSLILLEQISTIDKKNLGDYIGRLTKEKIFELDKALAISGGIEFKGNPIDLNHIADLKWLINDATKKANKYFDNEYHIRVRETLIKELKYYCNSCGVDFEKNIEPDIYKLTSIKEYENVI